MERKKGKKEKKNELVAVTYEVVVYIVMAYTVMVYTVAVYKVMAYIVVEYIVMAYIQSQQRSVLRHFAKSRWVSEHSVYRAATDCSGGGGDDFLRRPVSDPGGKREIARDAVLYCA